MLGKRIAALEIKLRRPKPRPLWAIITRESRDPYVARNELLERQKARPLSEADAAELARLEVVISNYELDLAV